VTSLQNAGKLCFEIGEIREFSGKLIAECRWLTARGLQESRAFGCGLGRARQDFASFNMSAVLPDRHRQHLPQDFS
jgi:hypothetical protein